MYLLRGSWIKLIQMLFCAVAILAIQHTAGAGEEPSATLVKLTQQDRKSPVIFGEIIGESDTTITVVILKTGIRGSFPKKDLSEIKRPVEDPEVAASIGIPALVAHKIRNAIPALAPLGAVAKLDGNKIYVTLGVLQKVSVGDQLIVFRDDSAIRDPVTGQELGAERRELVRAAITEAQERVSVAKLQAKPSAELKVGDKVEVIRPARAIALLPLVNEAGAETVGTQKLSDEIIKQLVNRRLDVVERSLLAEVLSELGRQQSGLFDAATAQKVGKQVGAYAVLIGSLQPDKRSNLIQLRLVEVETGRILLAFNGRTADFIDTTSHAVPRPKPAGGIRPESIKLSDVAFSELRGYSVGTEFTDLAPVGSMLVGVRVTSGRWGKGYRNSAVASIQPIYRSSRGDFNGNVNGPERGSSVELLAREGYAVGAIKPHGEHQRVMGLQLVFMRVVNGRLSVKESYESPSFLTVPADTFAIGPGDGRPIVGLKGWWAAEEMRSLSVAYPNGK